MVVGSESVSMSAVDALRVPQPVLMSPIDGLHGTQRQPDGHHDDRSCPREKILGPVAWGCAGEPVHVGDPHQVHLEGRESIFSDLFAKGHHQLLVIGRLTQIPAAAVPRAADRAGSVVGTAESAAGTAEPTAGTAGSVVGRIHEHRRAAPAGAPAPADTASAAES